jgi:sporadic carbohydrate cluster protein (TIGR04323 family)
MADRGYRGYIGSRPVRGSAIPQRVQNLVVRDYAQRRNLRYLLAATEYAMPGAYMMLEDTLAELDRLDGIVMYSLFLLPRDAAHRQRVYDRVIATGASLHAALEDMVVRTPADIRAFEDVTSVAHALPATPFGGRYEKTATPLGSESAGLLRAFGIDR